MTAPLPTVRGWRCPECKAQNRYVTLVCRLCGWRPKSAPGAA